MEGLTLGKKWPIVLFFLLLCLFILLPFISLFIWSVTKLWPWPNFFPDMLGLDSWNYLFSKSGRAIEGLYNSFVVAGITVIGNLSLGLPAARAISQKQFFGKGFVFVTLLTPLFIPLTVSVMGLHELTVASEFLPAAISVAIAHILVTLPYFIAMVAYQFKLMGLKLQEAAISLGASQGKVFIWVELPQILPTLLLACLVVMIISMSQYLPTWIMSGGTLMTLPLVIFPFASSGNASIVSAYSIWFFVPVLVLVIGYFLLLLSLQKRKRG
jgi:putative spermidine/putrescine transport system permease protein